MFSPKIFPGLRGVFAGNRRPSRSTEFEAGVNRPEVLFYPQVVETVNAIRLRLVIVPYPTASGTCSRAQSNTHYRQKPQREACRQIRATGMPMTHGLGIGPIGSKSGSDITRHFAAGLLVAGTRAQQLIPGVRPAGVGRILVQSKQALSNLNHIGYEAANHPGVAWLREVGYEDRGPGNPGCRGLVTLPIPPVGPGAGGAVAQGLWKTLATLLHILVPRVLTSSP
jgi:hypothetical protein